MPVGMWYMQATHPRFCCVVLPRLTLRSAIFCRLKCELMVVYTQTLLFSAMPFGPAMVVRSPR